MAKTKYRFNRRSLKYEKLKVTLKDRIVKFLSIIATGMVFSAIVMLITYNFFESPSEKILKRENEQYKLQYKILNGRINQISKVLSDIQNRDDNIYRVIFEADPIPKTVREAGYGGVDRYAKLEGYDNSQIITETTKKIDKIARQLYIQSNSFDRVFKMAKSKAEMLSCIPAIQPVSKNHSRLASGFGMRMHPIYKTLRMHTGVDFAAPRGTPIYATGKGVVIKVKYSGGYGKEIVIDHGYGYKTVYAHLSKYNVRRGQKVKRGQIIGYVGSTGLSIGSHVHYEVRKNDKPINPVHFFFKDLTPAEYEKVIEISSKVNQALS
jgi:murein DD-endopeptidase MepM/ murein hydrolase activator NlpD